MNNGKRNVAGTVLATVLGAIGGFGGSEALNDRPATLDELELRRYEESWDVTKARTLLSRWEQVARKQRSELQQAAKDVQQATEIAEALRLELTDCKSGK